MRPILCPTRPHGINHRARRFGLRAEDLADFWHSGRLWSRRSYKSLFFPFTPQPFGRARRLFGKPRTALRRQPSRDFAHCLERPAIRPYRPGGLVAIARDWGRLRRFGRRPASMYRLVDLPSRTRAKSYRPGTGEFTRTLARASRLFNNRSVFDRSTTLGRTIPMNKADMEYHHGEYIALISRARCEQEQGRHAEALHAAITSWPHIDGHMQFERRYGQGDVRRVDGLELVLDLAPLLFDFESLEKLDSFLKSQRRIERNTSNDWSSRIMNARLLLREAHALWNRLERSTCAPPTVNAGSSVNADRWPLILQSWEKIGVIRRNAKNSDIGFELATDFQSPTFAKCPSCGAVAKAPKSKFLDEQPCPRCRNQHSFVLLALERTASF